MTEIQNAPPIITDNVSRPSGLHLERIVLFGAILASLAGLFTAGFLCFLIPSFCEARASILVRSTRPTLFQEARPMENYDAFVNTQLALMKSPDIIDKALEHYEVAVLPIVARQRDKRGWLIGKLQAKREGISEIVVISIVTPSSEDSEAIVNAVVNSYFEHFDNTSRATEQQMLANLQVEKRRHHLLANVLQDNIKKLREADSANQDAIAFDQRQLDRVNEILDRIEDRIMAVTLEQRASGQIIKLTQAVASAPSHEKRLVVGGAAGIVVFFFTLLLSIVLGCVNTHCKRLA